MNEIFQHHEQAQKLTQLVERLMPLSKWGFKQSALFVTNSDYPVVIYDSEKCRVKFLLDRDSNGRYSVFIEYGRLHAPNDERIMYWHGSECHCWHRIHMALRFLDRVSPHEVAERQFKRPRIIEEFESSELAKGIDDKAERLILMHASIWEHYGNRLFDLFDLRQSGLWERFTSFVEEFHKKNKLQIDATPPEYKIC